MWGACIVLACCCIAFASCQSPVTDPTWQELYVTEVEPATRTLQNLAWVWAEINSASTMPTFNASTAHWPTSASDWDLAARLLEQPCITSPGAAICIAACERVPSWQYVDASPWDFCAHVIPQRCFPKMPLWHSPGNRMCMDTFRSHSQASNPLCPPGFISGSVNSSYPTTMEMWCAQVSNSSSISVVPSYTQLRAYTAYDEHPQTVEAIMPKLVHNLPPPHKKWRYDRASGNMIQCTLAEMALSEECSPVFDFISSGFPSSYCTSLCGGSSTVPAANVLDESLTATTTDVCCYSAGCRCTPLKDWAEIMEPGSTPFCLLADTITPSYTGGKTKEWWDAHTARNIFMSVAYREADANGGARIGVAPNGLSVWLIKAWKQNNPGVSQSNSFCGRGIPGELRTCSAWGVFAGTCMPINKLMAYKKNGDHWEILKDSNGQPRTCQPAGYSSSNDIGPASNPLLQHAATCYRGWEEVTTQTWGHSSCIYGYCIPSMGPTISHKFQYKWDCYCYPAHSMIEYNEKTDRVSSCSLQSTTCMPVSRLLSEPSDGIPVWSPQCYVSQNDGSVPCTHTRGLRASNLLPGTSINLCAVRQWAPAPYVTDDATWKGNWIDKSSDRALPYQTESQGSMSLYTCQTQCLLYGKTHNLDIKYCGMTRSGSTTECFCGRSSDNYQKHGSAPNQDTYGSVSLNQVNDYGYPYHISQSSGSSLSISVYEIQATLPDTSAIHACRPWRSYRQWQPVSVGKIQAGSSTTTFALCQNWPCNGCEYCLRPMHAACF